MRQWCATANLNIFFGRSTKGKEGLTGKGERWVVERVLTSGEGLWVDGEVDSWLAHSRVGKVRDVGMVETLKDAFLVEGQVAANLRYLGGGSCVDFGSRE